MSFLATDCARARESVSVQLDGELPEFDLDRLETHLRICPACAVWADEVREVTQQLRGAALEAPEERFVLPRRTRGWRVSSALALTSAAAIVATMFFAPHSHRSAVGLQSRAGSSRYSSAARQVFEARTVPLEDGIFTAVSVNALHPSFSPV
jgi:predicted anti-sigma-YlaC factor YlaD